MRILYGDVVALQYGRRAHFRAQGLGRPSSSRPHFLNTQKSEVARTQTSCQRVLRKLNMWL